MCSSPFSVGTIPAPELRAKDPGVQAGPHTGSRLDHSRQRELEIVSRHARIVAYPRGLPEAPTYLFPRGLGSASEAQSPARLGPGGAFFVFRVADSILQAREILWQFCRRKGALRKIEIRRISELDMISLTEG